MEAVQVEQSRKSPNKVVRLAVVVGIVAGVGVINYLSTRELTPPPPPPGQRLPFPAKEIQADHWINTGGKSISIKDLKGKIVLLKFWRFHCHACVQAIPVVKQIEKKYLPKGVVIVTIHTPAEPDEFDQKELEKFVKKNQITVPVAVDNSKATMQDYGLPLSFPTFVVINRNGKVVHIESTVQALSILEKDLKDLLAGKDLEKEAAQRQVQEQGPMPQMVPSPGAVPPSGPSSSSRPAGTQPGVTGHPGQ